MKRRALVVLLYSSVVVSACSAGVDSGQPGEVIKSATVSSVAETGTASWNRDVIDAKTPVLVDFYAVWCGPCKRMEPIIEKVATKYHGKVKVLRVDVDKNPELAAKYRIEAVPHMMLFRNGDVVDSVLGVTTAERLADKLEKSLATRPGVTL
jgi:thioredoxin 1